MQPAFAGAARGGDSRSLGSDPHGGPASVLFPAGQSCWARPGHCLWGYFPRGWPWPNLPGVRPLEQVPEQVPTKSLPVCGEVAGCPEGGLDNGQVKGGLGADVPSLSEDPVPRDSTRLVWLSLVSGGPCLNKRPQHPELLVSVWLPGDLEGLERIHPAPSSTGLSPCRCLALWAHADCGSFGPQGLGVGQKGAVRLVPRREPSESPGHASFSVGDRGHRN